MIMIAYYDIGIIGMQKNITIFFVAFGIGFFLWYFWMYHHSYVRFPPRSPGENHTGAPYWGNSNTLW